MSHKLTTHEISQMLEAWMPGLTPSENTQLSQVLTSYGDDFSSLDVEAITSSDPDRQLGLISSVLLALTRTVDRELPHKLEQKGNELAPLCSNIIHLHFFYMGMIRLFYKMRNDLPEALPTAIRYCKRQIEISSDVAIAMKHGYKGGLPTHTGYKQLAIIYEKEKLYDVAIQLCEEAYMAGWGQGATSPKSEDDWEKRVERLKKKKDKLKHVKSGKGKEEVVSQPSVNKPHHTLQVPCPNCGSVLNVPVKYKGMTGKCKRCNGVISIPL